MRFREAHLILPGLGGIRWKDVVARVRRAQRRRGRTDLKHPSMTTPPPPVVGAMLH